MDKGNLFYDIEVFKCDSLVVFKREDGTVYGKYWNDFPDRPSVLRSAVDENRLIGFNNYNYDDKILTLMMQGKSQEEIKSANDRIIRGLKVDVIVDPSIDSLDTMQQIDVSHPSLKQIEGNLGMSIQESSVPFDIDISLTEDQRKETELYCCHDVDATIRVYQLRKESYFDVKESLIQMLPENQRKKAKRWNTTTISANLLKSEGSSSQWSGLRVPDRLWRQNKNIPDEAWKMWEGLTISNINDKGSSVTAEMFGCEVTFGVGGLHGAPANPEVFDQGVDDADVKSMYPSIIVHPEIRALGSATDAYDSMRKERVSIKKSDPVRASALKLILNSVYGNFKNKYSSLDNPFASATVCIYGQIAAIELCTMLDAAGYRITNINTDGVMYVPNPDANRSVDDIKADWEKTFGLELETEHFDKIIQRDVNNYIAVEGDSIKAKGGDVNKYSSDKPFSNNDCRIVQIALVDNLVKGTPIEETFSKYMQDPKMWQYVLKAGPTYRSVEDADGNVMNKVNRVFAAKQGIPGTTQLKKWKADGTSSKFADAPECMYVFNDDLGGFCDFEDIVDTDHYKSIVEKKLKAWSSAKRKPMKKTLPVIDGTAEVIEEKSVPEIKAKPVDQLEHVAKMFSGAKRHGKDWKAYCPVHEADGRHNPSLLIWKEKRGQGVCVKCMSQDCKEEDILKAAGITLEDLGRSKYKNKLGWKLSLKSDLEERYKTDDVRITDTYDYTDEDGKYLWTKVRYYVGNDPDKKMMFVRKSKDGEIYYEGKGKLHPDSVLYNVTDLDEAVKNGAAVYYVEGEKDVETLRKYNKPAVTAGGVKDWRPEMAEHFRGASVTIMADNDTVGKSSAHEIEKQIAKYAFRTRVFVPSSREKGDITDYLEGGQNFSAEGDIEAIDLRLKDLQYTVSQFVVQDIDRKGDIKTNVVVGKLAQTIMKTEHFVITSNADDTRETYYRFDGRCYKKRNIRDLSGIIQEYIPCSYQKQNDIRNAADSIRNTMAARRHREEMDTDDSVIITRNGVIDLDRIDDEGRFELIQHSPKYRLTTCLNTDYDPEADCPTFVKYINDLCKNTDGNVDKEKMKTIQEYCGLIISNMQVMKTKKSLWLYSQRGNTGKSQLIKVLTALIGEDKQCNVPINTMNRERNKFSMSSIEGKRMIQIPDMSSVSIEDSTVFKQLLGGDRVTLEAKGQGEHDYQFMGGLIVACNGLPTFKDDKGDHIAERMIIIPCENHIEENERDVDIADKMIEELPGILNWLLDGVKRYRESGKLTISYASLDAAETYKTKADSLYRFLSENYEITKNDQDRIKACDFDDDYEEWFSEEYGEDEKNWMVKKRNVKDRLLGYGVSYKKAKVGNFGICWAYVGLKKSEN